MELIDVSYERRILFLKKSSAKGIIAKENLNDLTTFEKLRDTNPVIWSTIR